MASLTKCADGRRRVQFFNAAGERRSITLSSCTDERAREIRAKIKTLNADGIAGQAWAPETARWLARQDAVLYAKLAAVGLVPPREVAGPKTLAAFIDAYIDDRTDVKPGTPGTCERSQSGWSHFSARIGGLIRSPPAMRMSFAAGSCGRSRRSTKRRAGKKGKNGCTKTRFAAGAAGPNNSLRGRPQAAHHGKPVRRYAGRQRSSEQVA